MVPLVLAKSHSFAVTGPRKPDWGTDAIVPADKTVRVASRTIADLPKDVTPGAKDVAG